LPTILYMGGKQLVGSAAHQAGNLLDVVTGTGPGKGSYAEKASAPFSVPPTKGETQMGYDEKGTPTDAQLRANISGAVKGAASRAYDWAFGVGPKAQAAKETLAERIPQAAEAAGTVATIGGGAASLAGRAEQAAASQAIEEGHPLTAVAKSEQARLEGYRTSAQQQGLELPDRQISPAQEYANNAARRDVDLPKNSPVTANVLEAARDERVGPAYAVAKKTPEWTVSPKYQKAMSGIDTSKIDEEFRPPVDGTLDGKRAVELTQKLRYEASQYLTSEERTQDIA
jgi:hypothetical protein